MRILIHLLKFNQIKKKDYQPTTALFQYTKKTDPL